MNKEMKNTILNKSIRTLIIIVLILVAIGGKKSQTVMIIVTAIWAIFIFSKTILKITKWFMQKIWKGIKFLIQKIRKLFYILRTNLKKVLLEESEPQLDEDISKKQEETMLYHIALRITEKLKSAYPKTTWSWETTPNLKSLLSNKTVRILVEGMGKYTHADINFDTYGRIHITPMSIRVGSFKKPEKKANENEEESKIEVPEIVDIPTWYKLRGQEILKRTILELNANGHTKLSIKENGDIVIYKQKQEVVKTTLETFPQRNYWEEFIEILHEEQLKATIYRNEIKVSWM